MKIIYLIVMIFSLATCKTKDTGRNEVKDNTVKTDMNESIDSLQMQGYVILYDTKTNKAKDTISLTDIKIKSLVKTDNYPSSQKDKSICSQWMLDPVMLKEILKTSNPIQNNVWHYSYDHLSCNYQADFILDNKTYQMNINGGSWISISNENMEGKIGCSEKKCIEFFLSEPLSVNEIDSKN